MQESVWVHQMTEKALQRDIDRLMEQPEESELSNQEKSSSEETGKNENTVAMQEVTFDPDKSLCCSVENGHTLVHGAGGRGYGLGATAISSGCYQWKVCTGLNHIIIPEFSVITMFC